MATDKDSAYSTGRMATDMRAHGKMIKNLAKESCIIPMAAALKASGKMIRPMVEGSSSTRTREFMRGTGKIIYVKGKAFCFMKMEGFARGNGRRTRRMVSVCFNTPMGMSTTDTLEIMFEREVRYFTIKREVFLKVSGITIKLMAREL